MVCRTDTVKLEARTTVTRWRHGKSATAAPRRVAGGGAQYYIASTARGDERERERGEIQRTRRMLEGPRIQSVEYEHIYCASRE